MTKVNERKDSNGGTWSNHEIGGVKIQKHTTKTGREAVFHKGKLLSEPKRKKDKS